MRADEAVLMAVIWGVHWIAQLADEGCDEGLLIREL
jgi:hypothetical protein